MHRHWDDYSFSDLFDQASQGEVYLDVTPIYDGSILGLVPGPDFVLRETRSAPGAVECDNKTVYESDAELTVAGGGDLPMGIGGIDHIFNTSYGITQIAVPPTLVVPDNIFVANFKVKRIVPPGPYQYNWEVSFMYRGAKNVIKTVPRKFVCRVKG